MLFLEALGKQRTYSTGVAFLHLLLFRLINWNTLRNTAFYAALHFPSFYCKLPTSIPRYALGRTCSCLTDMAGNYRKNIYSDFQQALSLSLPTEPPSKRRTVDRNWSFVDKGYIFVNVLHRRARLLTIVINKVMSSLSSDRNN
jgi:hypothetical protein